jgi:putative flippase GtrA
MTLPGNTEMPAAQLLRDLRQVFTLYTLAAGTAAMVDVGVFYWLSGPVQPIFLAAALSFTAAATYKYVMSALFVYRTSWWSLRRIAMYLAACAIGLTINAGTTTLLAEAAALPPVVAKIAGVGLAFIANFTLNTFVVFRDRQPH